MKSTPGLGGFKAIGHCRNRQKLKVHRFTNNLQGLQDGNGERLLLKSYSMKCFTFWENIKKLSICVNRELRINCKHMSWHGVIQHTFVPICKYLLGQKTSTLCQRVK